VTHKYLEEPKQQAHEPPIPPELMHRVLPPDPGIPDVALVGDLSLTIGVLSILSTFVTARLFESPPSGSSWSVWSSGSRASGSPHEMHAPGSARGRGTAGFGIALAIIGMAFAGFGAAITSILNGDSIL
jgi:hypothetical protein